LRPVSMVRLWTSCLLSLAVGQVGPVMIPRYGQAAAGPPIVAPGPIGPYVSSLTTAGAAAPYIATTTSPYVSVGTTPYVSSTVFTAGQIGPIVAPAGVSSSLYPLPPVFNPYGPITNQLSGNEPVGPISGQPVVYGQVPGHFETQAITTQTAIPQAVSVTTLPPPAPIPYVPVPTVPASVPVLTTQPVPLNYGPVSTRVPQQTTYGVPHRRRHKKHDDDYDYGFDWGSSFFYYFSMGCKFAPKWCGVAPFLAGEHRFNPLILALFTRG